MSILQSLSTATHLSVFEIIMLASVVGAVLFYVALSEWHDRYQERSRKRFFDWLDSKVNDNVIALYRNTDNFKKYHDYVITEAGKAGLFDNQMYCRWIANDGINLLWKDLPFTAKLVSEK
ncbi:hypothetical protein SM033_00191 [Vibrio phage vB_VpaM_sm033]|nr:hypothetical protein SM033_00191 [Vibrio phage vB_VpaM_sm033]